jgi:hypothetical protein
MRKKIALVLLAGFLAYTGSYIFIYLARAFSVEGDRPAEYVGLHHADNFSRTLLVGILFLIAEVFVLYLALGTARDRGSVTVRADLSDWLKAREELTGEPVTEIAERAISSYRMRLEGGGDGPPSAPPPPS